MYILLIYQQLGIDNQEKSCKNLKDDHSLNITLESELFAIQLSLCPRIMNPSETSTLQLSFKIILSFRIRNRYFSSQADNLEFDGNFLIPNWDIFLFVVLSL